MRYAHKRKLNGVDIIAGIGECSVDPQATKRVSKPLIEKSKAYERVTQLNAQFSKAMHDILMCQKKHSIAKSEKERTALSQAYAENQGKCQVLQESLKEAGQVLQDETVRIRKENAVYFQPSNSMEVTEELENLFSSLKPDTYLTPDGKVLAAEDLHKIRLSKMSPVERKRELDNAKQKLAGEYAIKLKEYELLENVEGEKEAKAEFKFRLKALEDVYDV